MRFVGWLVGCPSVRPCHNVMNVWQQRRADGSSDGDGGCHGDGGRASGGGGGSESCASAPDTDGSAGGGMGAWRMGCEWCLEMRQSQR